MVAGAEVFVDTVADTDDPFAAFECVCVHRSHASLPFKLALTFGNDHLQAFVGTGQCLG